MNTAVICFPGGNDFIKQKQIKQILKEENERKAILCEDYDQLDEVVQILREDGIKNLVIIHEEDENFRNSVMEEYDTLFEKIEVVNDFSKDKHSLKDVPYYRAHLLEANWGDTSMAEDAEGWNEDGTPINQIEKIRQDIDSVGGVGVGTALITQVKNQILPMQQMTQEQKLDLIIRGVFDLAVKNGYFNQDDKDKYVKKDNNSITKIIILPVNPPIVGTNAILPQIKSKIDSFVDENTRVIVCTNKEDGAWCSKVVECITLLSNGEGLGQQIKDFDLNPEGEEIDSKYPMVRSVLATARDIKISKSLKLKGLYESRDPTKYQDFGIDTEKYTTIGLKSMKLYSEMLKDKGSLSLDFDKEKLQQAQEWLGKEENSKQIGFFKMIFDDIETFLRGDGSDRPKGNNGKSVLDNALNKLGVYKDIASAKQQANLAGAGLLWSAAGVVKDAVKKGLEKNDEKKRKKFIEQYKGILPFITHDNWEEFAACFDKGSEFK